MNWFSFNKQNLISIAIGIAFLGVGLGLYFSGWIVSLGILPFPIIGLGIIIVAIYRILVQERE